MAHTFLDAEEVTYLQSGIDLKEARDACADLGLPSGGSLEALRERLCAHYEIGSVGGAAAEPPRGLSRQGSAPPPPGSRVERVSSRGSKTTAPRAVVHRGYLEKKGGQTYVDDANVLHKERHYTKGGRRNWKQRWFVLFSDGELHYYTREPGAGEVLPPEKMWKGALQLVGVEEPYVGRPCCWHVRDSSPDELLLALPSGISGRRNAMLLRSTDESVREGWIAATTRAFGSKVAPLLYSVEERGIAERSLIALRAKLASSGGHGGEMLDVAATLPSNQAIVLFDFAAEEPTDLALARGSVVVLTQTEGEWWHGHLVGTPDLVGMFPATYVARGTGAPQAAHSTKVSLQPPATRHQDHHRQRLQISKGAKGFGMSIQDDGVVGEFTFPFGNPAKAAGVVLGMQIVAVDGVTTAGKAAIIAELQRVTHKPSVEFTFEHHAAPPQAAGITVPALKPEPEPEPEPSVRVALPATPTMPSVPPRAVLRRGWLEKKGGDTYIDVASNVVRKQRNYTKGGRRSWKPRWFILYVDGELAYFDSGPVESDDPLWHDGEPDESTLKGRLRLTSARGGSCSWHVQEHSQEFILALPVDEDGTSGNGSRRGLLLRHEEEPERQAWIGVTQQAFGSSVSSLIEPGSERGLPVDLEEVAARLPSTEAVALYDFDAQEQDELRLTMGVIVALTETEGEWWRGHVVGAPGTVGMFPATYVARGVANA